MDRKIQPEIQTLKNFRILPPVRMTLPNGIPLTVINAGEQEVVRIDVLFAGARWQQSQKLQALFTNRMLREGTTKYTAATIAEKLDYYGSWLELSSSSEYAYITVYSLNKYLAKTLEVVESMIKEPLFPEKELHTILDTNIQQYLVNTSKVDFLAHRSLLKSLYGEQHPCGKIVVEEDYHAITPEVLREFYERYYHSGNCSIFLSGKVTEDIISRVTDTFGTSFGKHQQPASKLSFPFTAVPEKRIFIEREDAMQSAVKMGYTTITRNHPDYLKLRVLMTLFGGSQHIGKLCVPGKKTFYKACHNEHRNSADHYFQASLRSSPKRFQSGISAGKQPAVAQSQSGGTGHDNRPDFKRSVQPDGKTGFPQQIVLIKECLKSSYHDTIGEKHIPCSKAGQQSHCKAVERDHHVIKCNAQEHRYFGRTIIYGHRLPIGNIVECHIHITVSQYQPDKIRVIRC